ncbi:uncharacterized protein LOC110222019 isoform X2 [Phascolarctos cinereus]|uniref:Uncharacterized protein LOC110222019 isoform X2 n=1 Tax=Phascolarctos cinereus TaxID=38626 RepID=A0A6P5LYV7_PHACI|nr:uncharacterized protein LOC110222019 isoform X2 [Phascolarctos cinereus]
MESSPSGPQEKKGTRHSYNSATPAIITRSEEYLARVSTELANEALMGAQYTMSPDVPKELKKLDQGTQMSRQERGALFLTRAYVFSAANHSDQGHRSSVEDFKDDKVKLLKSKEKDLSQHKQVETVQQEETLGGTKFLTTRRPACQPSTDPESLSSLTSRKEQGNIKNMAHSPILNSSSDKSQDGLLAMSITIPEAQRRSQTKITFFFTPFCSAMTPAGNRH